MLGLSAIDHPTMTAHYFKRYRMECDLRGRVLAPAALPSGCFWTAWRSGLAERHALVKFQSFRDELDAEVFESLGDYQGCLRLMHDIADQPGFLAEATWLLTEADPQDDLVGVDCGTIQGVIVSQTSGCIQNVGIIPSHRGQGLGRALVTQCLLGFQAAGMQRVTLEVTADNRAAVALYRQLGFTKMRTMYREVEYEEVGFA